MSDSLQPHGLQPTRLLYPWNSPGQNTGVGKPFASLGDLLNPGFEPRFPSLQADSLPFKPLGKLRKAERRSEAELSRDLGDSFEAWLLIVLLPY